MQTRGQQYARKIHEQVSKVVNEGERKQYGSMAHKLPVLVRTAGLAQALAFVEARGSEPAKQLLEDLAQVVEADNKKELLDRSRTYDLVQYMHLTQKVMTALIWYKRFAQSVLGVDAGDDKEGE